MPAFFAEAGEGELVLGGEGPQHTLSSQVPLRLVEFETADHSEELSSEKCSVHAFLRASFSSLFYCRGWGVFLVAFFGARGDATGTNSTT